MALGFSGEVVEFYHSFRRGYPTPVIDALVAALGLRPDDALLDLGCGTGQLTVPPAGRCRAVIGMDPEPDMLHRARLSSVDQGVGNASWLLGADSDVPALGALLGSGGLGAVTIGQALHWMDHDTLFRGLRSQLRPGGAVAVVTNGEPAWSLDTDWSRALRGFLESWLGRELTSPCGTDDQSQRGYGSSLRAAGYDVSEATVDYATAMTFDQLLGGVYSTFSADRLPPADRRRLRRTPPRRRATRRHLPRARHRPNPDRPNGTLSRTQPRGRWAGRALDRGRLTRRWPALGSERWAGGGSRGGG